MAGRRGGSGKGFMRREGMGRAGMGMGMRGTMGRERARLGRRL